MVRNAREGNKSGCGSLSSVRIRKLIWTREPLNKHVEIAVVLIHFRLHPIIQWEYFIGIHICWCPLALSAYSTRVGGGGGRHPYLRIYSYIDEWICFSLCTSHIWIGRIANTASVATEMFNPSHAEATFDQNTGMQTTFENHLNPVIMVFIG